MTLKQVVNNVTEMPASKNAVVDIQNLSLTFQTADGPVYALSEVDLTIEEGEFVSFIGPSGCGKTTLLRVIADLEKATGAIFRSMAFRRKPPARTAPMAMCSRRRLFCPGGRSKAM